MAVLEDSIGSCCNFFGGKVYLCFCLCLDLCFDFFVYLGVVGWGRMG